MLLFLVRERLEFFVLQWQNFAVREVAVVGLEADKHRLDIAKQYGCEDHYGDATIGRKKEMVLVLIVSLMLQVSSITLKIALELVRPNGTDHQSGMGAAAT